jgi:type IV pilus assembly protein PilE
MHRCRSRGFTLVECAVVLAVVAILAAVVMPSWRGHALRAARLDGAQALTRLQAAQEQHRSLHGLYAGELSALKGVHPVSDQGRYTLAVQLTGPESYLATAQARGAQAQDHDCPALTLDVRAGFAQDGPDPRCWDR